MTSIVAQTMIDDGPCPLTCFLRKAAASSVERRLACHILRFDDPNWFATPRTPPLWQRGFFLVNCFGVATLVGFGEKRCRKNLPLGATSLLQVSTRSPTPDEQRYIDRQGKLDFDTIFLLLGMPVVPSVALWFIGGWLGGFISPDVAMWGRYVGCVAGFILSIYPTKDLWLIQREWRRLGDADRADSVVEVLTVETDQVVELFCHGSHQPCLVFDLGDNQLLYLHGQWIWDTSTYSDAPFSEDGNEEYFNLLEPPDSFPADTFLVSRLPNSGDVFGIHVTGEYLEPDPPIDALTRDFNFNNSEIVAGMFDDIPNALQAEYERRRGT